MSTKSENIKNRYLKGYVTEEQLLKYMEIGVITHEEYIEIKTNNHGG